MDELPGSAEHQFGASEPSPPKDWYSRGYLPHRDHPGLLQGITYHLGDSLPREALERMEEELRFVEDKKKESERRKKIEAWLDAGYGSCVLRDPRAAKLIVDTWRRFAGIRYDLIAWVVMPNHVHALVRMYEGVDLGKVVQSWKNYTARKIREMGLGGAVGEGEKSTRRTGVRRSQDDTRRTGVRRVVFGMLGIGILTAISPWQGKQK